MATIARRRGKRLCPTASRRPRPSWPRLVPPPQSPPTVALVAGFSTQTVRQRPAATNRVVKGHRRCGGPEGRSAPPRVATQRDWKEVRHAARTRTVGVAHARASVARCIQNREGAARKKGSHTIRCWMVLRHGAAAASTRRQRGDNRRGETLQAPLVRTRRRACQRRDLQRGLPRGCRPSTHQTQPFLSVCGAAGGHSRPGKTLFPPLYCTPLPTPPASHAAGLTPHTGGGKDGEAAAVTGACSPPLPPLPRRRRRRRRGLAGAAP